MISDRLRAALNGVVIAESGGMLRLRVDDVDRRYRDAIKAGATPLHPPQARAGERVAQVRDGPGAGVIVEIVSGGTGTLD